MKNHECKKPSECSEKLIKVFACQCWIDEYHRLKRMDDNIKKLLLDPEITVITKGLLEILDK